MKSTAAFRVAAAMCFLEVALGAFGAHGLHDLLERNNTVDVWKTASEYHLAHAIALLFLASLRPIPRLSWILIFYGVIIFSGSLYLLAVTNMHWLGAITPVGGLSLLAGWLVLAVGRWKANGD